ncbi:DEAD/DEAH box helicase [Clostridium perfringens]|uniref:type I restriction endonuclease subunit R n=1 Tax=Clostridium perfringens TaxID=1502 RepID=UPI0013D24AF3|nr:HsdR family type I site-specific deoxyribonuclease [Clostridium perfringens]ELC8405608.1 type I restriction endonuclease subunit R [Clostridium perfringens]KAF2785058.1 DEAD/DEAH box helicase [Clostridium perfringens]
MIFNREEYFEEALIGALQRKGWEKEILKYPTEDDLIRNWADILFENNRSIDRLNDQPLTDTEMEQILEQVTALRTPLKLNSFINGKTVSITRDNPNDKNHLGKEISLKIYDRLEIAAGQSRYQIAKQPIFKRKNPILNDRRGDFMLLINGMPVIHVELKKSNIPVSQAYNQIEKYAHEGIFTGIYSLVQVFVAMNPEECVYFANPGPDGKFNKDFYFHWADFNNEPINDWKGIAARLLSIPMAHQLIGFYTVADDSDGILKVMRSYQYYAANAISDKVSKINWDEENQLGGYIWHTTGSGKTMSSFKSAQLIANSKDADKVVFLMDRVELGTQSLHEYRAFSDETDDVQATENTRELIAKLKSDKTSDTLIVTSIQKMSRIEEDEGGLNSYDIEEMNNKRIVFIIDEAHRSTFGDMLITVKQTFPNAVFFGFTGTPIYDKNKKKDSTTSTIFGSELHRYTIADGIRDGNVLGFDPYKCGTYKDNDIRKAVALEKAKATSEEEVFEDDNKKKIFLKYMNDVPMAGYEDENGRYQKGIEDYVKNSQYNRDEHRKMVVKDIFENWLTLSQNGKFHAIFATSSIPEAIKYYRLIKEERPDLKITALFDSNIDNNGNGDGEGSLFKEDGLLEIIQDYNELYGMKFDLSIHDKFKKDISSRLSHKKPYERIANEKNKQLDILIVVDQMLTGFDSKWVNTLYLDKILKYENIIQAFSRTNRLFGPDKPFGVIRYYRKPNTMEKNIEEAVKYYSGDREVDLFVEQLPYNLTKMCEVTREIENLFDIAGIENFEKLPDDSSEKGQFAKLFKEFNGYLEAAKVQGFKWDKDSYKFNECEDIEIIDFYMGEDTYLTLAQRYKELAEEPNDRNNSKGEDVPYDIDGYLTEIDTGKIDINYMNSRFEKYLKNLIQEDISPEELQKTLDELHKSFASLNQEEQKFANIFLHDVESGDVQLIEGRSFREYITEYQAKHKNKQVQDLHNSIGVDIEKLETMLASEVNEKNINEYGRFDDLESTIDKDLAKEYLEKKNNKKMPPFKVTRDASKLLREFVLSGGFDIHEDNSEEYQIEE